ncbi:MAG: hypothetical protein ACK4OM_03670 [Alphaproteobacteria bacterium]
MDVSNLWKNLLFVTLDGASSGALYYSGETLRSYLHLEDKSFQDNDIESISQKDSLELGGVIFEDLV